MGYYSLVVVDWRLLCSISCYNFTSDLVQVSRFRLAVIDSDCHSRLQNSRFLLKISRKKGKCGVIVLRARSARASVSRG